MIETLNADEIDLLDRVVLAHLGERFPAVDWATCLLDLKSAGRLQLAVDAEAAIVALDGLAFVSVDRERLQLALLTDDPLAHVRQGKTG